MADSKLRLILILQQIPRAPRKVTTRDLRSYLARDHQLEVDIRTIQRDLEQLSTKFDLIQIGRLVKKSD